MNVLVCLIDLILCPSQHVFSHVGTGLAARFEPATKEYAFVYMEEVVAEGYQTNLVISLPDGKEMTRLSGNPKEYACVYMEEVVVVGYHTSLVIFLPDTRLTWERWWLWLIRLAMSFPYQMVRK